jgi:drug/metabolite transporter (DMT)-like permease
MNPTPLNRRSLNWWQCLLGAAGAGLVAFMGLGVVEHHANPIGWPIAAVAGLSALILTGIGISRLIKRTFKWWQLLLCAAGAGLLAFMSFTLWEHHPNPVAWAFAAVAGLVALMLTAIGIIRLIK